MSDRQLRDDQRRVRGWTCQLFRLGKMHVVRLDVLYQVIILTDLQQCPTTLVKVDTSSWQFIYRPILL